jgi:signal transduction histidine kinase/ActR/RegA family two-component response regulator
VAGVTLKLMAFVRRFLLRRWVPYAVLSSGLILTLLLAYYVTRTTRAGEELRLATVVDESRHLVQIRLDTYVELLRAGAALFAASTSVTTDEFKLFAARLQIGDRYPGLQGIGLVRKFTPQEVAAGDPALDALSQQGVTMWPPGRRPEYMAVVALEPERPRRRASLGYDMFTEPTRRAAMETARDTGEPAASGVLTLVQEIDETPQRGFLIYMPVYRTSRVPTTVEERRRAFYGFVYSPFRGDELLTSVLPAARDLGFSVYDGTLENAAALLHAAPLAARRSPYPPLRAMTPVEVAGRQWTIVFTARPYLDTSALWVAPAVLFGGILLSLALFGIMRTQLEAWEATARHAAELRASEEAQRETGERLRRLVTLEREARAEAQQADRAKDEFLATLSHELRTPLNAMLGWIMMLRSGKVRQERRVDALDVIERNARTQARLIEDLLDVSRIITGKVRLDLQPIQVAPILHTAVEAMRPGADSKKVALRAVIAMDAPAIMGDPNRVQQIIWNLLSNAIKFTPSGGEVRVELAAEDDSVRLAVIDTGIGIAPEFLPHVFERFRQADSSSTRAHSGVGLGLSIVRHLVQLHDGSIEAKSDGQDKGAQFVARFPAAGRDAAGPPGGREKRSQATLAGVRVLVVEDEDDSRDLLQEALLGAGAVVRSADSAEAALAVFGQEDLDIIISDIGMPGVDGYELMRRIRRLPGERGAVPSIAVTAYARPGDREHATEAGFHAHLTKPVDIDELLRTVAALVHNARFKMQPF